MKKLIKRIGLPTPPIGKLLRGAATVLGIGGAAASGGDTEFIIYLVVLVAVLWITGDMQVVKEFKHLLDDDKDK